MLWNVAEKWNKLFLEHTLELDLNKAHLVFRPARQFSNHAQHDEKRSKNIHRIVQIEGDNVPENKNNVSDPQC